MSTIIFGFGLALNYSFYTWTLHPQNTFYNKIKTNHRLSWLCFMDPTFKALDWLYKSYVYVDIKCNYKWLKKVTQQHLN